MKKFSELRAGMSDEAQARAADRTTDMLAEARTPEGLTAEQVQRIRRQRHLDDCPTRDGGPCVCDLTLADSHNLLREKLINTRLDWDYDQKQRKAELESLRAALAQRTEEAERWRNVGGEPCSLCHAEKAEAVKRAEKAEAELAQAREQRDWQPIESAPKDGREILCTWVYDMPDGRRHWAKVMHVLAWWPNWHDEGKGAWVLDGDFAARFEPDGHHETPPTGNWFPTHWMPLPDPPLAASGRGSAPQGD